MTNTSTNAGTTLKRTVALAAAASLAVMGTCLIYTSDAADDYSV